MAPIRILELRSVRGTGGGPEKTILLGAQRADPARFAVTVCYMRDLRDRDFLMDGRARELGVDYVEIEERHSFDPSIWKALRALVRERQIDIVHAHEYKSNLLTWLLAKAEGIIPLSTVHGWFGRDTWRETLYYGADKRILARYPRLIAVSSALKAELVRTGSREDRVQVIPNGIDHVRFVRQPALRPEVRRELGLADTDVAIGAVGRLEHQKRFDLLLEAFATLRAAHPQLRLLIAGDGGLKADLAERHARLGLATSCVLLGHQADVPRLHHGFDVFVQSSDGEGSPNVVLEAMALETPLVATDVGGTRDMVEDGVDGFIVPPGDVPALADAMARTVADLPAARARATHARRRIETELSFEVRMNRVEAIYEALIASTRSGRQATEKT
ncbi:MAG: glycosyltransferase [Vicinamibacterales bacterium]